jgi:hypothetical protein
MAETRACSLRRSRAGACDEPMLVAVHTDPLVVLPRELGRKGMHRQAEEFLWKSRDEIARTPGSTSRLTGRLLARSSVSLQRESDQACVSCARKAGARSVVTTDALGHDRQHARGSQGFFGAYACSSALWWLRLQGQLSHPRRRLGCVCW